MDGNRRPFLAAAAVLGLVLRLAFALGYWVHEPLTRDEREYLSLARSLTAGRGLVYDADVLDGQGDPFGRSPGYPAFLAAVGGGRDVATEVPTSVKAAQALVGALGVLIAAVLAGRLAGPRAARAAAVIAAIYPPLVTVAARAFSEALFWPLSLAVVWSFDRALEDGARAPWRALVCGVLAGATVLVRPAVIFFLPLALIWFVWRRRPQLALACAIGATLAIGPWSVRNYAHYGRFVLVASEGGVTFWTGNHPLAVGDGDLAANPSLARAKQALRAGHPGVTEEQMEPVYYREAFDWIRSHPVAWLRLEARKLFYLVVPIGPSYTLHSTRYYAASALPYLVVLGLAIVGVRRARALRSWTPGVWLLLGAAVGVCLIFFPSERFRMSGIDPELVVIAGSAWASGQRERPAA